MTRKEYDDIKDGLLKALDTYPPLSSREMIPKLTTDCDLSTLQVRESMRRMVDDGDLHITKDLKLVLRSKTSQAKW